MGYVFPDVQVDVCGAVVGARTWFFGTSGTHPHGVKCNFLSPAPYIFARLVPKIRSARPKSGSAP